MESKLFQPWRHGSLRLRNRVVMAPMTRRMAEEDGLVTDKIVAYYRRRAREEVGLIISEGTGIDSLHSYDTLTVPRFDHAGHHEAWRRVVEAVHEEDGAFAPQLWHTGRAGVDPIGPSTDTLPPKKDGTERPPVREMESDDFAQVLEAYRTSARAAQAIGCDALEIHGAHGYLLDSFLSASTNRRTDEYGGNTQNRFRFPLEVVRATRGEVGPDFPIIYRFSQWKMDDYKEQKFQSPDDLEKWVTALREAGVDILHVSTRDATDPGFEEHGGMSLAGWSEKLSGLPTIAVGKVSVTRGMDEKPGSPGDVVDNPAEKIALVDSGEVSLLAVGRALIANPNWVSLVRAGRWNELKPFQSEILAELI